MAGRERIFGICTRRCLFIFKNVQSGRGGGGRRCAAVLNDDVEFPEEREEKGSLWMKCVRWRAYLYGGGWRETVLS